MKIKSSTTKHFQITCTQPNLAMKITKTFKMKIIQICNFDDQKRETQQKDVKK
jgi:hypothetical protein